MDDFTIIDACHGLFRPWIKDPETFQAWFSFLKAMFVIEMTDAELAIYQQCTGRNEPPAVEINRAALIVGRRGGKSLVMAIIACYLATVRDYREYLVPGETASIVVLAKDRDQAAIIFNYIRAILTETDVLIPMVESADSETITLTNRVKIEVTTASFRSVRGRTIVAAICDEIAFWRNESSANPDDEILKAIRPALLTIPNAKLLLCSSPYARKGSLYKAFKDHHGKENDAYLIWNADTRTMNPTVPQSEIDAEYEDDPANAAAEYGANFRNDIETFVSAEIIEAVTIPGRTELPRMSASTSYAAFIDAAGGSGQDSMCIAIAHATPDGTGILDAIRERKPPFSPEDVTAEFADLLTSYGINTAESDRWGGDWVGEAFRKHGVTVEPSAKPKSDIYREVLPLMNSKKVEILDIKRLSVQLGTLERRTARGGRDSIDHPPGGHDDVANVVAGVLVMVAGKAHWSNIWEKLAGP
jgi:hypothetical protein